ncbi:MAG TPA: hypothetical protein VFV99_20790 [Kofleriaceae bacterium]|nr:hypothetical protein [Kofleriaceae bacterium]
MRSVVAVVCLVGAGCDVVWRLDDVSGGISDAPRAVDAPSDGDDPCPWGPRVQISAGGGNHDPQLSEDGLELFFVRGASGTYDIWRAVRTDVSQPFPMGVEVAELSSSVEDTDPTLAAGGNTIVFKSTRGGTGNHAWLATRSGRGQPFTIPVMLTGVPATVAGVDLSADGLTLYVDDGGKLVSVTRIAGSTTFMNEKTLTLERTQYPSVSADGLELYYNGAGVVRRKRQTTNDMFDPASLVQIDDGAADPDLTFGGTRLVMTGAGIVYVRERCAP